ncbi:unnamed protein product [Choristocarpus tenellus]
MVFFLRFLGAAQRSGVWLPKVGHGGDSVRSSLLKKHFEATAQIKVLRPLVTGQSRESSSGIQERPFKVLGMQQIAIGAVDKQPLINLWRDILGVEKVDSYSSENENVDEDILQLGKGMNAVEVDIMQPLDPEKAPRVHVPTLNHIGLWVHPLPECVEWLTARGVRFTPGGIRKGASGHDVAFIHPKGNVDHPLSGEGVLIELVQAPADVVEDATS